ncbi:MAG: toll/interleukin-1 receptor domain-containing protein [Hyphomonadaceae bacterium]|nr:toll/interleukin-1 receptor domain-containing protein [Hyphomonadaceae bacterium]
MTVFISHARADLEAAEALESLLERRGQFVERDDGEVALAPVAPSDVVVTLISHAFAADANRLRLTLRALDAWSAGRLLLVRLDEAPAPIGLRDLPSADASVAGTRDLAFVDVATEIQKLAGGADASAAAPGPARRGGAVGVLVQLALAAPGLFAVAAMVSIWLANRIGPRPGGMPELLAGIEAFGRYYGAPAGVTLGLFGLALALLFGVLARLGLKLARAKPAAPAAGERAEGGVFVSAAASDAKRVEALLQAARGAGAKFAAPTLEAAGTVLVMCSSAAYESDQVKRDVFLADRGGKRVRPVFLDAAAPPDDFAYFFAADAGMRLHEVAPAEQGRLLAQALGAAAPQAAHSEMENQE